MTYVPSVRCEGRVVLDDELQLAVLVVHGGRRTVVADAVLPLELDDARPARHETHVERRTRHLYTCTHTATIKVRSDSTRSGAVPRDAVSRDAMSR